MSQTYSKEEAHQKVADLVEAFQAVEPTLGDSQESQIEEDYIRPLFSYLNWGVQSSGVPDSQKEVLLVKTDRRGKRPDYTFQHGGQRLFFMDAKKVKYEVKSDPRWLWQVYKYGWLSHADRPLHQVDFGVVTDFQEFVLLDCTFKVEEPEAVLPLRVWQWDCIDYVNQFDKLWEVFERNNMVQASRDRKTGLWSCRLSPKQTKANRVLPDKGFLDKLDNETTGWRIRLAKDMKRCNPALTGEVITSAVQLLIDRLVFIKALSDRGIDDDYLAALAKAIEADGLSDSHRGWYAAAQPVFAKLNRFYNGSIFVPRIELESATTSNKVVRSIIREMEPDRSPYDLAVLPVAILGTIYERFLGKVVRTTDQRVKIEEKPEVRKAGGVFYTQEYIVTNIVEQTVGKLLAGCKTPDDVAKLKILDLACGSGSFVIGVYDVLIEWYKKYYATKAKPDRAAAYRDADGEIRLTAKLKRQILINNIFGVDIDTQAVEVTRFSLSLKALEDTRKEELDEERNLFKETVLPDLKDNIVCGNSLIGEDIFDGQLAVDEEDRKRINPMDWEKKFPAIMADGGFHAIIGNPPYVRQEGLIELKGYLQQHYEAFSGTADLYTYFMERSINLLRPGGRYSIIVSSSFLRVTYAASLREALKKKAAILRVVDFGGHAVFADAKDTYVCIPVFTKATQPDRVEICRVATIAPESVTAQMRKTDYTIPHERLSSAAWSLKSDAETALFQKLCSQSKALGEVIQGRMYRGALTGLNEALIVDATNRTEILSLSPNCAEFIKPCRGGEDCRRYFIKSADSWMIVIPCGTTRTAMKRAAGEPKAWEWFQQQYAGLAHHLAPYTDALRARQDKGNFWWELRPCDYYSVFDQPKIVFPDICKNPRFGYDDSGLYLMNTAYALGTGDKYLLGILNSRLFWFAIANISIPFGVRAGEFRYRLIYQYMEKIPVRPINHDDPADKLRHDRMISFVEQMLVAKKGWEAAQTEKDKTYFDGKCDDLDEQINALVYELYGLTKDEIALVEQGRAK